LFFGDFSPAHRLSLGLGEAGRFPFGAVAPSFLCDVLLSPFFSRNQMTLGEGFCSLLLTTAFFLIVGQFSGPKLFPFDGR